MSVPSLPPVQRLVGRGMRWLAGLSRQGVIDQVLRGVAGAVPYETWERNGFHLTPNAFYSPIPDSSSLSDLLWTKRSELPGIDLREDAQVELLRRLTKDFGEEFNALPHDADPAEPFGFFLNNKTFERVDSELLYGLIRQTKPRRIIEIGSGWSTVLALRALRRNVAEGHPGRILALEPYPSGMLVKIAEDELVDVEDAPLQLIPLSTFEALTAGDILFIDSTHVCRIGSDVQYEFLEILPRLPPGVLVHIHDIFLPREYPRDWVLQEHRAWNEQYVLQAFLEFNDYFEVLWAGAFMHLRHPDLLEECVASYTRDRVQPGSFWMRTRARD